MRDACTIKKFPWWHLKSDPPWSDVFSQSTLKNTCFFLSEASATIKTKKGNREGTLNVPWWLPIFISSSSAAGDCHQNGKHWWDQLLCCHLIGLSLLAVCMFFFFIGELGKFRLRAWKKLFWWEALNWTPYC